MQKKTKKLDQKIQQITVVYKQLQKTQFYIVKKNSIDTLRKLCAQALEILDQQNIKAQNIRRRKQVQDMLKRCLQIQKKIEAQQIIRPSIGSGKRNLRSPIEITNQSQNQTKQQNSDFQFKMDENTLRQKSRQVAKSMIFYQITSQNMKITAEQLDQLALRMQKNNNVMKEIQLMVIQQGGDIDKIESSINQTYQNVQNTNIELDKAAQMQKRNRILKIRMGISTFFGAIGLKILGLPGLLFGFFGGMVATQ